MGHPSTLSNNQFGGQTDFFGMDETLSRLGEDQSTSQEKWNNVYRNLMKKRQSEEVWRKNLISIEQKKSKRF